MMAKRSRRKLSEPTTHVGTMMHHSSPTTKDTSSTHKRYKKSLQTSQHQTKDQVSLYLDISHPHLSTNHSGYMSHCNDNQSESSASSEDIQVDIENDDVDSRDMLENIIGNGVDSHMTDIWGNSTSLDNIVAASQPTSHMSDSHKPVSLTDSPVDSGLSLSPALSMTSDNMGIGGGAHSSQLSALIDPPDLTGLVPHDLCDQYIGLGDSSSQSDSRLDARLALDLASDDLSGAMYSLSSDELFGNGSSARDCLMDIPLFQEVDSLMNIKNEDHLNDNVFLLPSMSSGSPDTDITSSLLDTAAAMLDSPTLPTNTANLISDFSSSSPMSSASSVSASKRISKAKSTQNMPGSTMSPNEPITAQEAMLKGKMASAPQTLVSKSDTSSRSNKYRSEKHRRASLGSLATSISVRDSLTCRSGSLSSKPNAVSYTPVNGSGRTSSNTRSAVSNSKASLSNKHLAKSLTGSADVICIKREEVDEDVNVDDSDMIGCSERAHSEGSDCGEVDIVAMWLDSQQPQDSAARTSGAGSSRTSASSTTVIKDISHDSAISYTSTSTTTSYNNTATNSRSAKTSPTHLMASAPARLGGSRSVSMSTIIPSDDDDDQMSLTTSPPMYSTTPTSAPATSNSSYQGAVVQPVAASAAPPASAAAITTTTTSTSSSVLDDSSEVDKFVICSDNTMECVLCAFSTDSYSAFKSHIICSHPCWRITKKLSKNRLLVEKSVRSSLGSSKGQNASGGGGVGKAYLSKDDSAIPSKPKKEKPITRKKQLFERNKRLFKCTVCLRMFVFEGSVVNHVMVQHRAEQPYDYIHISNDHGNNFGPIYRCTQKNCFFSCESAGELERHTSQRHLHVIFRCQLCGFTADTSDAVRKHGLDQHQKELTRFDSKTVI